MNCLVHNPYIWLKYCFLSMARAVKLKNRSCPSLPLPNIQWREGIYKHSSSKRAKDMCMPLAIEATNLLQVKSSWANEVPWIGSKVGRFSYCFLGSCCHLCFFMRSSTYLPWEIFFSLLFPARILEDQWLLAEHVSSVTIKTKGLDFFWACWSFSSKLEWDWPSGQPWLRAYHHGHFV